MIQSLSRPTLDKPAGHPLHLLPRLDQQAPGWDPDLHPLACVSGPDVHCGQLQGATDWMDGETYSLGIAIARGW